MRAALVVGLLALFYPALAMAQNAPASSSAPAPTSSPAPAAPSATPKKGGDITRDQYIERAKENAAKRFDRMDTDHDGVLTLEERRAYHAAHSKRHPSKPQ